MGVKVGYKETEVGVIPEDWEVFNLGKNFEIYAGGDVDRESLATERSSEFPYPIYANALRNRGLYGYTNRVRCSGNAVTVTGRGSLGHAEYRSEPFYPIVRLLVLVPNATLDPRLAALLINEKVEFSIESTGVPQLTAPQVRKYSVGAPSDPNEQSAIAQALGDVDAMLAELDRLIVKKRNLKTAVMQQLLAGETRLPGFTGEWVPTRLGDISKIKTGSRNNQDKQTDGEFPFFVRSNKVERIDTFSYDCEAILIPGEGNIGSIFHYINGKFDVHQRVYAIMDFEKTVDIRFLFHQMKRNFGAHAMKNTVKATVDSLRLPTFQNFVVDLPPTREEQTKIASALGEIDAESEALAERHAKIRELKTALMQELLTGKTRLPFEEHTNVQSSAA